MKTEVRKCVKAFRRTLELAAGEHKEQWNGSLAHGCQGISGWFMMWSAWN